MQSYSLASETNNNYEAVKKAPPIPNTGNFIGRKKLNVPQQQKFNFCVNVMFHYIWFLYGNVMFHYIWFLYGKVMFHYIWFLYGKRPTIRP